MFYVDLSVLLPERLMWVDVGLGRVARADANCGSGPAARGTESVEKITRCHAVVDAGADVPSAGDDGADDRQHLGTELASQCAQIDAGEISAVPCQSA